MTVFFDTNPDRSTDELLEAVSVGLKAGGQRTTLLFMMAPFAALLVRLSRDSEKTAQQVVRLTKWLISLTIALLLLGAMTFAKDGYELYEAITHKAQDQPIQGQSQPKPPQGQSRLH